MRGEEFNRFPKQHGAMGRAFAPQRRSHHHRPVILFKELSIGLPIADLRLPSSALQSTLDSQSRDSRLVFFRVGIRQHAGLKLVELPNFQISQVTHHRNVADHFRALPQQRMN